MIYLLDFGTVPMVEYLFFNKYVYYSRKYVLKGDDLKIIPVTFVLIRSAVTKENI